jgi:hypothetical protein
MLPTNPTNQQAKRDADDAPRVERPWSGDIAGRTKWRTRFRYAERVLDLWSAARPLLARLGEGKDWA